jgi:dihydroflavonol-4-reductase
MRVAITGATGLLGGNLAVALVERGHDVVATRRKTSDTSHLEGLDVDWIEAPLSDVAGLTRAFDGADVVYHCAAAVSVQYEVKPWIYEANVVGTRNVIRAVENVGGPRLVHCSSVVAIGASDDGEPCTEDHRWNLDEHKLDDAYAKTKYESQQIVIDAAREDDLDAVVVNPNYMIGPYDARPSSGELVLAVINRQLPGYSLGMNNFVDVRDVVRGMILAAEHGRAGEKYILGGHNLTYKEFMDTVSRVAGTKPIRRRVPRPLAAAVGVLGETYSKLTRSEPLLNRATVRWYFSDGFIFSSEKATRELGYEISPLEPAIRTAIDWFRDHDML